MGSCGADPPMQGSTICYHEHFVVLSDVNNGFMTTPAVNKRHDDVTELSFGML